MNLEEIYDKMSLQEEKQEMSEQQPTGTQDIHAVLREMSGVLAGLKVEMRYLQQENKEQAKKTRELEQQYQVKVNKLESQKTKLKQQYQEQAAELLTIKAQANTTENHVNALTREGEVKRVAFSASLSTTSELTLGPFNTYTNLIFRNIVTNVGNAYNPNTGFFTAPVRAAYHFEFYIHGPGPGHPSNPTGAALVKNGAQVFSEHGNQTSGSVEVSNGVTLLLEVGDVVFLQQWRESRISDRYGHCTTFSGRLLFTL